MSLPNLVPFQRKPGTTGTAALRGWEDVHREMDRIFDSFFNDTFARSPLMMAAPDMGQVGLNLDVAETDKAYTITAELPGLEEKDIDLSLSEGVLTLKGEKLQEEESEGKTFHRVERRYGSFRRVLQLPGDIDEKSVNATMKNGVLKIEIGKNKKAEPSSRKISIKAG